VSLNDLRDYKAIVHENNYVIKLDNVHRMYVPPPPSSGILVAFIMKLMKGKIVFWGN
jgi:gamma-glutamyltranspeptidase